MFENALFHHHVTLLHFFIPNTCLPNIFPEPVLYPSMIMMMMCQGFQMILWYDVFRCIQMYSVIRINNVIKLGSGIRVIADCRLPPALLDQNWFVERVIWKVLLLHNKILNCCLAMVNPFFNWFFFRYFLILSAAPVASILASDILYHTFTKNWQYAPQNWIMATIFGPKRNNLNNQTFQQL